MDLSKTIWGGDPLTIGKPSLMSGSIDILGGTYPVFRLVLIGIGIAVAIGLFLFQERTRFGSYIRAGVDDKDMVSAMGINIGVIFVFVFALGAFLAGFAGVVGAPFIGIYPGLDLEILVLALIVVVIGGLGTLQGALLGSMLIGLVLNFGKAMFPEFSMYMIYILAALVLVFKPSGLLGRREA
jgi:branched-chain amino acid transport system permease protein